MNTPMNSPILTATPAQAAVVPNARVLLLGSHAPRRPAPHSKSYLASSSASADPSDPQAKPSVCRRLDFTEAPEADTPDHSL